MSALPSPAVSENATERAYWLELMALAMPNRTISPQDLVRAVKFAGSVDVLEDAEELDDNGPTAFHDAVKELCAQMGEGIGCRVPKKQTAHFKDAKLDIVVWIPFGDGRPNQLSVFGQCAADANWRHKINELQPVDFCKQWLSEHPALNPYLAYFVPRHIEESLWLEAAIGGYRLLFDRLRIARLLHEMDTDLAGRCANWTESALARLRENARTETASGV